MGEIFPSHIRTKGIAIAQIVIQLYSVWITMAQPTAQKAIGYKFYLLFVVFGTLGGIVLYWYLPETKGVPLEEIAKLFGDEVAVLSTELAVNQKGEVVADETHHHV